MYHVSMNDAERMHRAYEDVKQASLQSGSHTHEDFDRCPAHQKAVQLWYQYLSENRHRFCLVASVLYGKDYDVYLN